MHLQKANSAEEADSTTREEFEDNMYHIMKSWKAKTNDACLLSFDNAKIQATADLTTLYDPLHPNDPEYAFQLEELGEKLDLPAYSHDLNRPIEHVFGTMKHRIREELYSKSWKYKTATSLQSLVWQQFHENLPPNQVQEDIKGLPLLWEVLMTPAGVTFIDANGKMAVGTGGDWPNAEYR